MRVLLYVLCHSLTTSRFLSSFMWRPLLPPRRRRRAVGAFLDLRERHQSCAEHRTGASQAQTRNRRRRHHPAHFLCGSCCATSDQDLLLFPFLLSFFFSLFLSSLLLSAPSSFLLVVPPHIQSNDRPLRRTWPTSCTGIKTSAIGCTSSTSPENQEASRSVRNRYFSQYYCFSVSFSFHTGSPLVATRYRRYAPLFFSKTFAEFGLWAHTYQVRRRVSYWSSRFLHNTVTFNKAFGLCPPCSIVDNRSGKLRAVLRSSTCCGIRVMHIIRGSLPCNVGVAVR